MSVIANFTFTIYEAADGAYGHIVDGKWVGMVGDVLYKVFQSVIINQYELLKFRH